MFLPGKPKRESLSEIVEKRLWEGRIKTMQALNKGQVELLAPAGSPEGFYGAVHAGADAVYLGGSRFGARAYAEKDRKSVV